MGASAQDISLRAEIGMEPDPMQGLVDGRLYVGVVHAAKPSRPED